MERATICIHIYTTEIGEIHVYLNTFSLSLTVAHTHTVSLERQHVRTHTTQTRTHLKSDFFSWLFIDKGIVTLLRNPQCCHVNGLSFRGIF